MNNRVLGNSLLGLHILGCREAERRVLDISSARKHEVRSTAAWIMGKMSGQQCLERLTDLVRDDHPMVRSTALKSLLEIRRIAAKTPEAIAARAAKADSEATAKAIEKPLAAIKPEPKDQIFDIRLDGSAFQVR
jgi:HEAT repeat protein